MVSSLSNPKGKVPSGGKRAGGAKRILAGFVSLRRVERTEEAEKEKPRKLEREKEEKERKRGSK